MKFLVAADDLGLVKRVVCERGTDTSKQTSAQPVIETYAADGLARHVEEMVRVAMVTPDALRDVVVAARAGGLLAVYDAVDFEELHRYAVAGPKDVFVAVVAVAGGVVACTSQGSLFGVDLDGGRFGKLPVEVVLPGGDVLVLVKHPDSDGVFAYGGKENDVRVVLVGGGAGLFGESAAVATLFQGKNVKNDKLDLRVPVWVLGIIFRNSLAQLLESTRWQFITLTRHGQIREYDSDHGRRPVRDHKVSDKPLITLRATADADQVVCSDTHTMTGVFSVLAGKLVAKYPGAVGSVQAVQVVAGLVAAAGLDRYVRVYDVALRVMVAKVYVGLKISAVWVESVEDAAVAPTPAPSPPPVAQKHAQSDDDDEMWDKLEGGREAGREGSRKRSRRSGTK